MTPYNDDEDGDLTTGNPSDSQISIDENGLWTAERLSRASYKEVGTPLDVRNRFLQHLRSSTSCQSSLWVLLTSESAVTRDYSLEIDAFDLLEADPVLGHLLLRFPATLLPLLESAIVDAQVEMKESLMEKGEQCQLNVKGDKGQSKTLTRVHARLVHLPPTSCKMALVSMQASDVGKIVQVSGTVVRCSPVRMYESCRTYHCAGKAGCGKNFQVFADLEQHNNALVAPDRCTNFIESNGGKPQVCSGKNFQRVENGSLHTDYQEITIQESASRIGGGHMPRSLLIKLEHDLVDRCQPGDEVIVVGNLLAQWHQSVAVNMECRVGIALRAHSVRVVQDKSSSAWRNSSATGGAALGELEDDKFRQEFIAFWEKSANKANPIAARNLICRAVCPKLYGLAIIKLALLLTLIGAVSSDSTEEHGSQNSNERPRERTVEPRQAMDDDGPEQFEMMQMDEGPRPMSHFNDGTTAADNQYKPRWNGYRQEAAKIRTRGQSHLLLVGDPGTGKSQFLRFAAALCPRSVLTTGVGTTSAGLTCAAVREGSGKEFSLEAGALVLADQGVCCIDEFGCIRNQDRTTIHEAMEQQTLSVAKAGIVCKLNCRATVIAVMNPRNCLYDDHATLSANTGLGTPLLSRFDVIFKLVDTSDAERDMNVTTYLLKRAIQGTGFQSSHTDESDSAQSTWNMEKLRAYISTVRDKFHPVMSDEAALLLERHYEKCRSAQSPSIPVTVRFLESMIRLSQAHARLMYHDTVTLEDAVAVIQVMESTAFAYGGYDAAVDDYDNVLYRDPMTIDFGKESDQEFLSFQHKILQRYDMLDFLSDDSLAKMHSALSEDNGRELRECPDNWANMENPRDRNFGGHSYSITQDHYGRYHMTPSRHENIDYSDVNSRKRPRR